MSKLTKLQRQELLRTHADKSNAALAKLLNCSEKTVSRDRQQLRPQVSDTPPGDDVLVNLKNTRDTLAQSLKVLAPGSEAHRKAIATLSDVELKIHKVEKDRPSSEKQTEWEFVAYLDSSGSMFSCRLADAPEEIQNRIKRSQTL